MVRGAQVLARDDEVEVHGEQEQVGGKEWVHGEQVLEMDDEQEVHSMVLAHGV